MSENTQSGHDASLFWWKQLAVLLSKWKLIGTLTLIVAVASVVVSLILPVKYQAASRLILPNTGSGGIAGALLGDISSAAASILGSGSGDYVRLLAILNSRTVMDAVVDEFDLIQAYELEDTEFPSEFARMQLGENVEFVIDQEYDFLSVEVLDSDPQRAADISNYFVGELDRINNDLSRQTAGFFRDYVENRYEEAEEMHQAMLDSLASFQRQYGVIDLEAQTTAFFGQVAEMRVEALQLEIQYESLKQQFGETNRQVQSLQTLSETANEAYLRAMSGSEAVFPVGQEEAPDMVRSYLELTMQRLIQERILEIVAPMLEQARFEEEKTSTALQIIDRAVAPVEKAKPQRAIVCIVGTLSGFVLIIAWVLLTAWWRENAPRLANRLAEAS